MILLLPFGLSAQDIQEQKKQWDWSLFGSYDISVPGDWKSKKNQTGFEIGSGASLGISSRIKICSNTFFMPNIALSYYSYGTSNIDYFWFEDKYPNKRNATIQKIGIRIPLTLGYNINLWNDRYFSILTGLDFGYGFYASISGDGIPKKNLYGDDSVQRRVNFSWGFGLGFDIGDFSISTIGYLGLINLSKVPDKIFNENFVRISLGYRFNSIKE